MKIVIWDACAFDHREELQKVLQQSGLDVNWVDPADGSTAAHVAAELGHGECLSKIIHYGADLSKMDKNGMAPIHKACKCGRIACLALLLNSGVGVNVRAADGLTPAIICTMLGHVKCLALLLDRKADPELTARGGDTAVYFACMYKQLKCLQLLIARRVNINGRNNDGETPLDFARIYSRSECVDLLLENHAVGMRVEDISPLPEPLKVCRVFFALPSFVMPLTTPSKCSTQESVADYRKRSETSRENAKRCDYPPCNASAADKNMTALKKCPRCGEGRYCCQAHCNLDWDRHKLLCQDIKLKVES
jgi:ankyrin repeat protein